MPSYDFSTLNDKELEVLSCDLFTRELGVNFQSFKIGKDKGIDLRYSTNNSENEIIIQVKHYLKSGFNKLIYVLKNQEKDKIDKLSPKRYILITSIPLSPTDKEKIKMVLSPHINNTNDIFGCDDLNMLLSKYSDLEKKHFKLWFSNTNILQKIINNGIEGRSGFIAEKIKKNLKVCVVSQNYEKAIEKLREHKILLITGVPGIGKTTLANLITYRLLSKDFRLVYIDDKIREGEDLFDDDPNVKQLFYFDDFLGSNYLEIINSRNTDKSIVNFIERVKVTPNKYLILTTRTTILNQARSIHEKLSRVNLESLKYEIEISNYNDYDKAKILYNHLYFNDIPLEMTFEIFKDQRYRRIIKHRNYNPRLIDFFTLLHNINHLKSEEYFDFILYHLENPEEIWESAITNQLSEEEKLLLFTLLTLGRSAEKENLEIAFEERIGNEVLRYGFSRKINIFNISFKNLLSGYITNSCYSQWGTKSYVDYINPSLRDYLILYFNRNNSEKWRLIESFIFIEQFVIIFKARKNTANTANYIFIEPHEIRKFLEIAESKKLKSIEVLDKNNLNLRYVYLFFLYRNNDNREYIDTLILEKIKLIDWDKIEIRFFSDLIGVLKLTDITHELYDFIQNNWSKIIVKLISVIYYDFELDAIKCIFNYFGFDYSSCLKNKYWENLVYKAVNRVYESEANSIIEKGQNELVTEKDFENLEIQVQEKYNELNDKYLMNRELTPTIQPFDGFDVENIIAKNLQADAEADAYQDDWRENSFKSENNDNLIDDLFSSFDK